MTNRYGMSRDYPPERVKIQQWLRAPGYKAGRDFRLEQLSKAFGLGTYYLRRYAAGLASMGGELEDEIVAWTERHPDLSRNNPETEPTIFASLKIE